MGEAPQVPQRWDQTGSDEPPAQLLRRAISHVESLLHRLEPAADDARHLSVAPAAPDGGRVTPLPVAHSAEKAEVLSRRLRVEEDARRQAATLLEAARREADAIVAQARRDADHIRAEAHEANRAGRRKP